MTRRLALAMALVFVGGQACNRKQDDARPKQDDARPPQAEASRKPDVPYEPTPHHVVARLLSLGGAGPDDVVYDLGCGDGRIVIAAARDHGAHGVCVDIDPERIRESKDNASRAGVADRIVFRNEDLFESEISGATLVTLFLWPEVNLRLKPKLWRELQPGTRVVSYMHDMGDWKPDEVVRLDVEGQPRSLYLWRIPPRSAE